MTDAILKTVLVTGGQGLIGNAIVNAARPFYRALVAGRNASCDMQVDLSQQIPDFSQASGGCWVHAAGVTDEECKENPAAAITRAALTTPKLIDAAAAAGVEKFVYVSSAHVYGSLEGKICETSPANPIALYAQCHFVAEQAFRHCATRHQKPVLILRPCAVYGMPLSLQSFKRWSLIPYEFPRDAVTHQKIEIRSSGLQLRNFVSTEWISEIVCKFMQENQNNTATIINPVGADDITVRKFSQRCAQKYFELTGRHCTVTWHEGADSGSAPNLQYCSIYDYAIATVSQLDSYLHDILTRLAQHAH